MKHVMSEEDCLCEWSPLLLKAVIMCNLQKKELELYSNKKLDGENMATFAERVHCSIGVFSSVQSIVWPYFFVFALFLSLS